MSVLYFTKYKIESIHRMIKARLEIKKCYDYQMAVADDKTKVILLDLPEHGNLGDQAIAVAEFEFLQKCYPNKYIYRFSYDQCRSCKSIISKIINNNDLIFLPGGGFIGSLWVNEQLLLQNILKKFNQNYICIFPHTIYFEDSIKGEYLKRIFMKTVSKHRYLSICARDKYTYDQLVNDYACTVMLVPDIVFSYKHDNVPRKKNKRILIVLRNDKEQIIDSNELERKILQYGFEYDKSSTIYNGTIDLNNSKKYVDDKIAEFSNYSLIICDRMHAMIFSFIANTPCIAFDNISGKIRGCYNWVKDNSHIVFLDNLDDLSKDTVINLMSNKEKSNFDYSLYDELKQTCLNWLKR